MNKLTSRDIIDHAIAECFRAKIKQDKEYLDLLLAQKEAREKVISDLEAMKHPIWRWLKRRMRGEKMKQRKKGEKQKRLNRLRNSIAELGITSVN